MLAEPARWEAEMSRWLNGAPAKGNAALRSALAVHGNNARMAAVAALESNFPVVRAMLGDAGFRSLAVRHAGMMPPADPRLCLYGRALPATIARAPELHAWPWLADVARLEWRVIGALFAADAPVRPRRLRADRPWPLAPATRWLASPHPVASLWQAHQPGAALPDEFGGGELALITRQHGHVAVTALPSAAGALLTALRQRTPLNRLAEADLAHLPALASAGALIAATGDIA